MNTDDLLLLRTLAKRFRQAVLASPKDRLPICLRAFPSGACGDTSLLLAQYLNDNGYDDFDYVVGYWNGRSHAWLERDGVIVDVTADQFDQQIDEVIVTLDRSWHDRFQVDTRHAAKISIYDDHTRITLLAAYAVIISYVKDEQ